MNWGNLPDFGEIGRSLARISTAVEGVSQLFQRLPDPARQMRRIEEDRESAKAELNRLNDLPLTTRRRAERLAAYCPRGCQVVAVYATGGRLLLDLRGDVLVTGKTLWVDVPDGGTTHPRGTHLPHRGHWLTEEMAQRRWVVDCHHGHYPVAGSSLLRLLPATGRVAINVYILAQAAC